MICLVLSLKKNNFLFSDFLILNVPHWDQMVIHVQVHVSEPKETSNPNPAVVFAHFSFFHFFRQHFLFMAQTFNTMWRFSGILEKHEEIPSDRNIIWTTCVPTSSAQLNHLLFSSILSAPKCVCYILNMRIQCLLQQADFTEHTAPKSRHWLSQSCCIGSVKQTEPHCLHFREFSLRIAHLTMTE